VNIPSNAVITSIDPTTGAATIDPPATGTETAATATIAAEAFNLAQVEEADIRNHSGFNFDVAVFPETITVTPGSIAATSVSDIADLRIGMNCAGSGIPTTIISGINRGSDTIYLGLSAHGSGPIPVQCYWGYQQNGTGIVISAQDFHNASGINVRGQSEFGVLVQGADYAAFSAGRQTASDARPLWGFQDDHTFSEPSLCDFTITQNQPKVFDGNTIWCVSQNAAVRGEQLNFSGVALPASPSGAVIARYSTQNGVVLNAVTYGQGGYFLPSAAHGTPSAPTALQNGDSIGGLEVGGFDGATWNYNAGFINTIAGGEGVGGSGNWSTSSHPTSIEIGTVPIGSTTPRLVLGVEQDGSVISYRPATAPTVSSGAGACGTSPTVLGSVMAGLISVGSGTVGASCAVSWPAATEQTPHCMLSDRNTAALIRMTTASTAGFSFAGSFAAGDSIDYVCGYNN
jgi:hypothetical protein